MNQTILKIITPSGYFYNGKIDIVTVKTSEGNIGLQHGKSPLVASIEISELVLGAPVNKSCAIAGGLLYVTPEEVRIITDAIVYKDQIDLARAEKERKEAEAALKQKIDDSERLKYELTLKRAINRIHVKSK